MFADQDMSEDIAPLFVAPSDEAYALSHEGSEHKAFEDLAWQLADVRGVHHADSRTQCNHVELQTEHWMLQMDCLVNAYLDYSSCNTGDGLLVARELEDHTQCLTDVELVDLFGKYILCQKMLLNYNQVSILQSFCTSCITSIPMRS
ncbi:hypothetical protein PISMIDRAFT_117031 [Pisolithus microcarpus 441]|uniref:Unplaced genomic scaffold scaffold_254, whole genome shotgun sequence n=1 Tax=Pisolithus microcarpus 441 TaxID=765257 RepID=A0A0C9YCH7_9AGAM|nr:hypothetical protein BKA83DRAFT_117031 [Pisolithus microcarpus]KIK14436.1 hypothetical protein PISMIDRAFT_117031 [Pisolithus microcarpus 441]